MKAQNNAMAGDGTMNAQMKLTGGYAQLNQLLQQNGGFQANGDSAQTAAAAPASSYTVPVTIDVQDGKAGGDSTIDIT